MKEYSVSIYVICRKQDVPNFENIHAEPHTFLKALFSNEHSAAQERLCFQFLIL